ncbi:MAG: acetoacetate decarboxylase family protein [Bacteroidota bacterium]
MPASTCLWPCPTYSSLIFQFPRKNGIFFNFYLVANKKRLQRLCDRWFNLPSRFQVKVKPASNIVSLTFVYYPKAWSRGLPLSEYGFMTYKEMIFSINVKAQQGFLGRESGSYGFIPFLLLDHPRAITAGREAFGMPKAYGDIAFPTGEAAETNAFTCTARTFGDPSIPHRRAKPMELVHLHCPPDFRITDFLTAQGKGFDALAEEFYRDTGDEISLDTARMLVRMNRADMLNLVQFRNPTNPTEALHQSIIEYHSEKVTMAVGGLLKGPFQLKFPQRSDSFPIQRALGLQTRVLGGLWYRMNFEFVLGKQLWDAEKRRGFGLLGW